VKRDDETDTFGRKGALSLPAFVPTTIRGYGAVMEFAEVDTRLLGAADRALFLSLSLSFSPLMIMRELVRAEGRSAVRNRE